MHKRFLTNSVSRFHPFLQNRCATGLGDTPKMKLEFEVSNISDRTIAVNELVKDFVKNLNRIGVKVLSYTTLPKKMRSDRI